MPSNKSNYSDGIECPECYSQISKVTDKRNYASRIWRRRKCHNNHVFTTIETVEDESENLRRKKANQFAPKSTLHGDINKVDVDAALSKIQMDKIKHQIELDKLRRLKGIPEANYREFFDYL